MKKGSYTFKTKFYMKRHLLTFCFGLLSATALAQITVTETDMPVSGDTLRYSIAAPFSGFSAADSGSSKTWDYSAMVPVSQAVDTYKKASTVNITYALTISPTAYGYKVADSIPGLGSLGAVTAKDVYTFYNKKTSPSRYVAEGFAAVLSGIPTPANYSDEDEIYFFPLTYARNDSSTFNLKFSIPSLVAIQQSGYRKSRVDGWGTIKTPYYPSGVSCIRVRQEIHEVDTIDVLGTKIGLPRVSVDYKFLVNGNHYPAVWVTANVLGSTETVTIIRYRDTKRTLTSVASLNTVPQSLEIFPNPAQSGMVQIRVPGAWNQYYLEVFDIQGKLVWSAQSATQIPVNQLANGNYVLRAQSGSESAYGIFQKQ